MNFKTWKSYFERNRLHFNWLFLPNSHELDAEERAAVTNSLMRLNELDQTHFLSKFAVLNKDEDYLDSLNQFIQEEQMHEKVLQRFLEKEGVSFNRKKGRSLLFRRIMRLVKMENAVIAAINEKILLDSYFKALGKATQSISLQNISNQICKDIVMQMNYHAYTLKGFYQEQSKIKRKATRYFHRFLMVLAVSEFWMKHKRILQLGGADFSSFLIDSFKTYHEVEYMVSGRRPIYAMPMHWELSTNKQAWFV